MELVAGVTVSGSRTTSSSSKTKTSKPVEGKNLGCGNTKRPAKRKRGRGTSGRLPARIGSSQLQNTVFLQETGDDKTTDHEEGGEKKQHFSAASMHPSPGKFVILSDSTYLIAM